MKTDQRQVIRKKLAVISILFLFIISLGGCIASADPSSATGEISTIKNTHDASLSGFTLINAGTDQPVAGYENISEGAVLDLSVLPAELNIRANVDSNTQSVEFLFNSVASSQGVAPFALCNDSAGDYYDCGLSPGSYTLSATPFDESSNAGVTVSINFQVVLGSTTTTLSTTTTPTTTSVSTTTAPATTTVSTTTASTTTVPSTTSVSTTTVPASTTVSTTSVSVTAINFWANEGGDKITRDELRATADPSSVLNSNWDGTKVSVFGAKNETVSFNIVMEAPSSSQSGISVEFDTLTGPTTIQSLAKSGDDLFDTRNRPIELFYVRYLKIEGLSLLSYGNYDERHIPERMRRPHDNIGIGSGTWNDRPDADKYYPDIAVPIELETPFDISANENQSVWADITIPKTAPAGVYTGVVTIKQSGITVKTIPVELEVKNFALPDTPTSKTMVYLGYQDINRRYTGTSWPNAGTQAADDSLLIRNRHFQMAHRHRISLIDSNEGAEAHSADRPRDAWIPILDGSLFTAANGYEGPGEGVGNGIYSITTYGVWNWKDEGRSGMETHTDAWESWFQANAPGTERFLYLVDESTNYVQTEQWAGWVKDNPGVGGNLKTFATLHLPEMLDNVPSLSIGASWFAVADDTVWEPANQSVQADPDKEFYVYNGKRPANGSFATEDDGVALRQIPWTQYKKGISRWFFWESTYYNNFQGGTGQTNVFQSAFTFGGFSGTNSIKGKTGWNYSNGDGVLFYPGTDTVYPEESYGVKGPIASLRLKHWRRGIQDIDYVNMAYQINASATQAIVDSLVPSVLWENGVNDPNDPTWVRTDISWPTDPEVWENARRQLADIIEGN